MFNPLNDLIKMSLEDAKNFLKDAVSYSYKNEFLNYPEDYDRSICKALEATSQNKYLNEYLNIITPFHCSPFTPELEDFDDQISRKIINLNQRITTKVKKLDKPQQEYIAHFLTEFYRNNDIETDEFGQYIILNSEHIELFQTLKMSLRFLISKKSQSNLEELFHYLNNELENLKDYVNTQQIKRAEVVQKAQTFEEQQTEAIKTESPSLLLIDKESIQVSSLSEVIKISSFKGKNLKILKSLDDKSENQKFPLQEIIEDVESEDIDALNSFEAIRIKKNFKKSVYRLKQKLPSVLKIHIEDEDVWWELIRN